MHTDHDILGIHCICFIQILIFSSQTDYVTELLEEVLRLREEVPSVKLAIQKAKETQQDTPPAVCTSYSNYSQTDKIKVVETQMNRFN